MQRLRITIRGAVQGVGFRPFVYRLASEMDLRGWVKNSPQGVFIEAEGPKETLDSFLLRLERERPPLSFIQSLEYSVLEPEGHAGFDIRDSDTTGERVAVILPDIATCPQCREELFDARDRRFRYPFTNCTLCGPRFSIIQALPYDRANTTMSSFVMCADCRREYEDPADRRFHAQPNACGVCGPQLALWDAKGATLASGDAALSGAAEAIRAGEVAGAEGTRRLPTAGRRAQRGGGAPPARAEETGGEAAGGDVPRPGDAERVRPRLAAGGAPAARRRRAPSSCWSAARRRTSRRRWRPTTRTWG